MENKQLNTMSKLTSVEWLAQQLLNAEPNVLEWQKYLLQAKEMHKQEIIDTYKNAQALVMLNPTKRAEQYFYELYKKDKQ